MSEIKTLTKEIIRFRDERDWEQFHNSKDLAIAITIEASELLESFLWKEPTAVDVQKVKEELADVFMFGLLLANKHNLDLCQIVREKMAINSSKYPIEKARGNAKKYDQL